MVLQDLKIHKQTNCFAELKYGIARSKKSKEKNAFAELKYGIARSERLKYGISGLSRL